MTDERLTAMAAALHDMGLCRTSTDHSRRAHEPDAERLLAVTPETPTLDVERSGDTFPNGWGCPCCDGTGFVSDEMADKLRALDAFPPDEIAAARLSQPTPEPGAER